MRTRTLRVVVYRPDGVDDFLAGQAVGGRDFGGARVAAVQGAAFG